MGNDVLRLSGNATSEMTDLRREIIATFVFGMAYAACRLEELTAPEVHALSLLLMRDVFEYDDRDAARVVDVAIRASIDVSHHDTVNAIIHQGIEAHREWQDHEEEQLLARLEHVLTTIGA